MNLAPIILFTYNRSNHTQRAVESLLKNNLAKDSLLIIYSDGPKNETARESVLRTRQYLKQISGFKEVLIHESESNLGLSKSIIKGVTEIVNKYERAIVLEDDLVVAPNFLNYMNAGLEKYKDDKQIMQISGYMYDVNLNISEDAMILPFVTGWGWATWKRAWVLFNLTDAGYQELAKNKKLRKSFNLNGNYDYFGLLTSQVAGQIDTWGVLWYLSVFRNNGLAVHPLKTLVFNGGFDGSGVNCAPNPAYLKNVKFSNPTIQFKFPESLQASYFKDDVYRQMNKELNNSLIRRMVNKIKLLLR